MTRSTNRSQSVHLIRAAAMEALEGRTLLAAQVGDVFYIYLENHNFTQPNGNVNPSSSTIEQLYGNPAAPYINSLVTPGNANAAQTSYATQYHNVLSTPSGQNPSIHPSEPNYVWQEAGVNGPLNDADPTTPANIVNAPNLSGLLKSNGVSWKNYQEDIDQTPSGGSVNQPSANSLTSTVAPQSQWTVPLSGFSGTSASYTNPYNGSHQYNFAPKHDGSLFFSDTNGNGSFSPSSPDAQNYAPLQQLSTDLANNTVARYNVISPNQFNDMHTALNGGFTYNGTTYTGDAANIAQGDNFLSKVIPLIENSQAYKNNGAIVIWNDEVENQNSTDATENDYSHSSTEIVISPLAKGNAYASTVNYTHSSDLLTLQETFGVSGPGGALGDAASPGTNDLSDLFKPGTFSPLAQPSTVPNAPFAVEAAPVSNGSISVSWISNSNNASAFRVERQLSNGNWLTVGIAATGATSLTDTGSDLPNGLAASTPYTYRVSAFNSVGNSSFVNAATAATAPAAPKKVTTVPNGPFTLSSSAATSTTVSLNWHDNSTNEDGYVVERSSDGGATYRVAGTLLPGSTTFTDQGLNPSTAYTYRVHAFNSLGISSYAGPLTVSTLAATTTPNPTPIATTTVPNGPFALSAFPASPNEADLTWHNNANNADDYVVQRSLDAIGVWSTIATLAGNATAYDDLTLSPSTAYDYRVFASNSVGVSSFAGPVIVTTLATGNPTPV